MRKMAGCNKKAQVLLLGDSICEGYREEVRDNLIGIADVYYVYDNGRFTTYMLKYIHQWADDLGIGEEIDIVHFNAGLWDVLRIDGDVPLVDINIYKKNLQRIINRLKHVFPNAQIIFALTTPVLEEELDSNFIRLNADIKSYNKCALEVMTANQVSINDLYHTATELSGMYLDGIHFSVEGARILGEKVTQSVMTVLSEKKYWKNFFDEKIRALQELKKRRIYIYGFGNYGHIFMDLLESFDMRGGVYGFLDNDANKQGMIYKGVTVISPQTYMEQIRGGEKNILLIAIRDDKLAKEISNQFKQIENLQIYFVEDLQYLNLIRKRIIKI